jgi:hypothetical protein
LLLSSQFVGSGRDRAVLRRREQAYAVTEHQLGPALRIRTENGPGSRNAIARISLRQLI